MFCFISGIVVQHIGQNWYLGALQQLQWWLFNAVHPTNNQDQTQYHQLLLEQIHKCKVRD